MCKLKCLFFIMIYQIYIYIMLHGTECDPGFHAISNPCKTVPCNNTATFGSPLTQQVS